MGGARPGGARERPEIENLPARPEQRPLRAPCFLPMRAIRADGMSISVFIARLAWRLRHAIRWPGKFVKYSAIRVGGRPCEMSRNYSPPTTTSGQMRDEEALARLPLRPTRHVHQIEGGGTVD